MIEKYIMLFLGWAAYGLIHSALATTKIKIVLYKQLKLTVKSYRIGYNILALLSILPLIYWGFYQSDEVLYNSNIYSRILSIILILIGLLIMLLIMKKYFREMSGLQEAKAGVLFVDGLHKYVRHPLYTGTFLLLIGIFFYRPQINVLISVITIILYTIFAVGWEEKKLLISLGEQYKVYCKSTPRFIPRFFAKRKII